MCLEMGVPGNGNSRSKGLSGESAWWDPEPAKGPRSLEQ